MRVAVSEPRAKVGDGPEGLELVIPSKPAIFDVVFLSFWICVWTVVEKSEVTRFVDKSQGAGGWSRFFWLLIWTIGGAWAIFAWLWMIAGRERIVLSTNAFIVRREILGVGWTREFDLGQVRNLRVKTELPPEDSKSFGRRRTQLFDGRIAFDYGPKTFQFGAVDEAEANDLVSQLKRRHTFG